MPQNVKKASHKPSVGYSHTPYNGSPSVTLTYSEPSPGDVEAGYVAEANTQASSIIGDVRTAINDVTDLADRLVGPIVTNEGKACAAELPRVGQAGQVLDTLQLLGEEVARLRSAIFRLRAL